MQNPPVSARRVQRVRHEIRRRDVEVRRIERISPHFLSVTFGGEALADFVSASFDDHVKVIFPGSGAGGGAEPVMRDYTPRHYDPAARELTIEFALHGDGPAANWAATAVPGSPLTIAGPRGSFIIPLDYDWHLLAGDDTALPAISRRLEELPPEAQVTVVAQVGDLRDVRNFNRRAGLHLYWVSTQEQVIETVKRLDLAGDGYAWCAGEAGLVKGLRSLIVDDKGVDRHAVRAAAYWKHGAIAHHENLGD